jgi:hypothetical protein
VGVDVAVAAGARHQVAKACMQASTARRWS